MSLLTMGVLAAWVYGVDHHWPDATSPVTIVFIIIYTVRDLLERRQ